jgi:segregation and condensation protein B
VSRAQVSEVRGVSVDGVMRTLQHRGYVAEVGRDPGPGQAVLYGTTTRFLEKLGIDSLEQLPALAQFVPGPEVIEALDAGLRHGKATPDDAPPDPDLALAEDPIEAAPDAEEAATDGEVEDRTEVLDTDELDLGELEP